MWDFFLVFLESVNESVDDQWYNFAAGFQRRQTQLIVSEETQVLCKEGGSVYSDLYLHVSESERAYLTSYLPLMLLD